MAARVTGTAAGLTAGGPTTVGPAAGGPAHVPASIPGVSLATRRALRVFYRAITWLSPRLSARLAFTLFSTPSRGFLRQGARVLAARAASVRSRYRKLQLQVYVWGGEGPSVLLMHGWSSHALRFSFLHIAQRISPRFECRRWSFTTSTTMSLPSAMRGGLRKSYRAAGCSSRGG